MRRNNSLRIIALALVITGSFIVLRSAGSSKNTQECNNIKQDCCKCKKQQSNPHQGGMIWENISTQFFS